MHRKVVGTVLFLLLSSFFLSAINAGQIGANGTIYVRAEKSPGKTSASKKENVGIQTLTDLMKLDAFSIYDLNHDGNVDMNDIAIVLAAFGTVSIDSKWNPVADVNHDGRIDLRDVAMVARHLGERPSFSNVELHLQGPFLYDEQGINKLADLATPQERVEFVAKVTNDSVPLPQIEVGFGIFDNNMSLYLRVSSVTDGQGLARVNFRMPWTYQRPEIFIGVWRTVATIQLTDQVVTDTVNYQYDYLLRVFTATTDRFQYNHSDFVQVAFSCSSFAQQTYPVIFMVSVVDELGVTIANTMLSANIGGAAFGKYVVWPQTVTLFLPKWASAGNATVHVNTFGGLPAQGEMQISPEYVGPAITIEPR